MILFSLPKQIVLEEISINESWALWRICCKPLKFSKMTNESAYPSTFEFLRSTFHFIFHISHQVFHACGSRCVIQFIPPTRSWVGNPTEISFGLGLDLECIIDTWFHRKSITVNIMESGNTFIIFNTFRFDLFFPKRRDVCYLKFDHLFGWLALTFKSFVLVITFVRALLPRITEKMLNKLIQKNKIKSIFN